MFLQLQKPLNPVTRSCLSLRFPRKGHLKKQKCVCVSDSPLHNPLLPCKKLRIGLIAAPHLQLSRSKFHRLTGQILTLMDLLDDQRDDRSQRLQIRVFGNHLRQERRPHLESLQHPSRNLPQELNDKLHDLLQHHRRTAEKPRLELPVYLARAVLAGYAARLG